jgi:hypothetical protein
MDRTTPRTGVRFLLAFALWASAAFVPAWWVSHPWQHALGALAARAVAPPGAELEMVDLQLFYPVDVAVFVALCLASAWASWPRRARALLLGVPAMILAEWLALVASMAAMLAAGGTGEAASMAGAARLADALIRATGLALAAAAWFALLGRERFLARTRRRPA